MEIKGWEYYNHAAIPTAAPDETPDTQPVKDGSIWKLGGKPLLARWTTDFDCGYETEWWYEIKDTPFDIASLNANRRYKITRGSRNFEVRRILPAEYAEAIYEVQVAAFSDYPEKYRPTVDHAAFVAEAREWTDTIYGAFDRETDRLSGYLRMHAQGRCLSLLFLKVRPECEKKQGNINAALIYRMMEDNRGALESGMYICEGSRAIFHETNFQEYLENYFGFRKAYCRLHIAYAPKIGIIVRMLYPFRGLLKRLDGIGLAHKVNAILKMEEIVRSQRNEDNHV